MNAGPSKNFMAMQKDKTKKFQGFGKSKDKKKSIGKSKLADVFAKLKG